MIPRPFTRIDQLVLFLLVVFTTMSACGTFRARPRVELAQDSRIVFEDGRKEIHSKKGDIVELPPSPAWIEAPGRVPVLVIPDVHARDTLRVRLAAAGSDSSHSGSGASSASADELLTEVFAVQSKLGAHQTGEALVLVDRLLQKYPDVVGLRVLKSTCLVVAGHKSEARAMLELVLRDDPSHADAASLLEALGGVPPKRKQRSPSSTKERR